MSAWFGTSALATGTELTLNWIPHTGCLQNRSGIGKSFPVVSCGCLIQSLPRMSARVSDDSDIAEMVGLQKDLSPGLPVGNRRLSERTSSRYSDNEAL